MTAARSGYDPVDREAMHRVDRWRRVRVKGPLDGRRRGELDTPVVIHDISEGGCFVNSVIEAAHGCRMTLDLLVSDEHWITVKAEVVNARPGFGFAVRFVEMPDATRSVLAHLVAMRKGSVVTDDLAAREDQGKGEGTA